MRNAFLPVAALALALAAPAGAQTASLSSTSTSMRVSRAEVAAPRAAHSAISSVAGTQGALADLDGSLRRLVAAQEDYWNHHGTYAENVADLGRKVARAGDVQLEVLFAGSRSWSARAMHQRLDGRSCVIYVGYADEVPELPMTSGRRVPAESRTPACDTP